VWCAFTSGAILHDWRGRDRTLSALISGYRNLSREPPGDVDVGHRQHSHPGHRPAGSSTGGQESDR